MIRALGSLLGGLGTAVLSACATHAGPASPSPGGAPTPTACCTSEGLRIAERYRVSAITTRHVTADLFWGAVSRPLASGAFRTQEIGRSMLGRPIRAATFGDGPTTVLLWSQMHGDESTATMALADIMQYLAEAAGDPLRERLRQALTIVFVPILNPDGAEQNQRRNAAAIDVNRDARRLATPEGRALKALRDRITPAFGFNLHDQNARTLAGPDGPQAAIALLAPAFSPDNRFNAVRNRARLVAATIARALALELPGRITRYDDAFNPRAFGDLMQQWGTSTVLVESGVLPNDPQKQRLRALNVVALLSALDAIATGRYAEVEPAIYDRLPVNHPADADLLVRGGHLVLPGQPPIRADVAITYDNSVARTGARIADVGDLDGITAIDTVDATGLFLHVARTALDAGPSGVWLRLRAPVIIELRRGPSPTSERVRTIGGS